MPKPMQSMYMWSVRPLAAAVPSSLATVSLNGSGVLVSLNTGKKLIITCNYDQYDIHATRSEKKVIKRIFITFYLYSIVPRTLCE